MLFSVSFNSQNNTQPTLSSEKYTEREREKREKTRKKVDFIESIVFIAQIYFIAWMSIAQEISQGSKLISKCWNCYCSSCSSMFCSSLPKLYLHWYFWHWLNLDIFSTIHSNQTQSVPSYERSVSTSFMAIHSHLQIYLFCVNCTDFSFQLCALFRDNKRARERMR